MQKKDKILKGFSKCCAALFALNPKRIIVTISNKKKNAFRKVWETYCRNATRKARNADRITPLSGYLNRISRINAAAFENLISAFALRDNSPLSAFMQAPIRLDVICCAFAVEAVSSFRRARSKVCRGLSSPLGFSTKSKASKTACNTPASSSQKSRARYFRSSRVCFMYFSRPGFDMARRSSLPASHASARWRDKNAATASPPLKVEMRSQ
mgnify:CR=1 FL=1